MMDVSNGAPISTVFISYSRTDREFALRLSDALQENGICVFRDIEDMLPTEEWWTRIVELIGGSDTVVFIISPDSVTSPVCAREIELCAQLNKRVAPIVWREAEAALIPEGLSKLNYAFFTAADDFAQSLNKLLRALQEDIRWVREHTRLGELARRWEQRGRRGAVVSGDELEEAETWLLSQTNSAPSPTMLHRDFVLASRAASRRRQTYTITGALLVTIMALSLSGLAYWQRG